MRISIQLFSVLIRSQNSYKVERKERILVLNVKFVVCDVGPCRGNQLSILNSKFLDYAVLVLNSDKKILDLDLITQ